MSLVCKLRINDGPLVGMIVVRRVAGGTDLDSLNTYSWEVAGMTRPEDARHGRVQHRYGDGATALLATVMDAWRDAS